MPISGKVQSQALKATLAAMPPIVRDRLGTIFIQGHVTINAKLAKDIGHGRLKIQGARAYRASHYAHMVEFGTVKMAAHPFMGPAFTGQQGPLNSRMQAAQRASIQDLANVGSAFL